MTERPIDRLLAIMQRLRDPAGGCPWDLEQTFESIAPYTLEEAYEVADAIARGDMEALEDELGDLLLQVVYHAEIARERGLFDFDDVCRRIVDKMIRRHPHVFGDARIESSEAQRRHWEETKAAERAGRTTPDESGALAGVPIALPALVRAVKLQQRAARVGFDWPQPEQILDKLEEESSELHEALGAGDRQAVAAEIGDMLFTLANLARRLGIDPEAALRATNERFERRFRTMEEAARRAGRQLGELDLAAQEALWQGAKREERRG